MQFNLFSLFVLTTVAAVGCAIARLPIDPMAKAFPIFAVVVCYVGWAVRNHKYPDPRQQPASRPLSRTRRWLQVGIHAPMYAFLLYGNNRWPPQIRFQILWYLMATCFACLFAFQVWYAVKPDPQPVTTNAEA